MLSVSSAKSSRRVKNIKLGGDMLSARDNSPVDSLRQDSLISDVEDNRIYLPSSNNYRPNIP